MQQVHFVVTFAPNKHMITECSPCNYELLLLVQEAKQRDGKK